MADLQRNDGRLRELALFAGAGGGILGGHLLGWRTICAVENDPYAASILAARQNDGLLPPFPIWDDIRTFDGFAWRDRVDIVSGGFPCQDISAAGKGAGIDGTHSGLWSQMAQIVCDVEPTFVWVENSPKITSRGLDKVLGDLAQLGYDAKWGVLGAADANAPHFRNRMWILAYSHAVVATVSYANGKRRHQMPERQPGETDSAGIEADISQTGGGLGQQQKEPGAQCRWWETEPCVGGVVDGMAAELDIHGAVACGGVGRVATGVPNRSGRIKAIGNGQVPAVAAMAWRILSDGLMETK